MEKKITFVVLFIAFMVSCKNFNSRSNVISIDNFDTIFFASNDCMQQNPTAFLVEGTTKVKKFILLKTIAKGSNIWVDSLLFERKGQKTFFSIIRKPTQGYFVLYYNSDSLIVEKVSWNLPNIDINYYSDSSVVVTKDSIYNSGYLNFINSRYTLSDSCILIGKESYLFSVPPTNE